MNKVILIHGYTSSPTRKKYQIISRELAKLKVEYAILSMPGDEHPHSKEWIEIIHNEVKKSDKPVVLVGHSLGTRAILLYLDTYHQRVDSVILFGAFNNDAESNQKRQGGNYADFFEYRLDVTKIKKLAVQFIVVHSKDDDRIDYQQGVEISKELNAQLVTYEHAEHFSGEERAEENAKIFLEVIKSVL